MIRTPSTAKLSSTGRQGGDSRLIRLAPGAVGVGVRLTHTYESYRKRLPLAAGPGLRLTRSMTKPWPWIIGIIASCSSHYRHRLHRRRTGLLAHACRRPSQLPTRLRSQFRSRSSHARARLADRRARSVRDRHHLVSAYRRATQLSRWRGVSVRPAPRAALGRIRPNNSGLPVVQPSRTVLSIVCDTETLGGARMDMKVIEADDQTVPTSYSTDALTFKARRRSIPGSRS